MALNTLLKVMVPPTSPVENGSGEQWAKIEMSIGTSLPDDYKEYIQTFGTGKIGKFLLPFNPFSKNEFLNLSKQIPIQLGALRSIKEEIGDEECPYPLYPEADGLLPWGTTDNGDVLFWMTTGTPNLWSVVISEARGPLFEEYQESMTAFLTKLLSGSITSKLIPRNFLKGDPLFTPL